MFRLMWAVVIKKWTENLETFCSLEIQGHILGLSINCVIYILLNDFAGDKLKQKMNMWGLPNLNRRKSTVENS